MTIEDIKRRLSPKRESRLRKGVRALATVGLLSGLGLVGHGSLRSHIANKAARKAMLGASKTPYSKLIQDGIMPRDSIIFADRDSIMNFLRVTEQPLTSLDAMPLPARIIAKALRKSKERKLAALADSLVKGENSMFGGMYGTRPVFMGSPDGMPASVAGHEVGHYRDFISRDISESSREIGLAKWLTGKRIRHILSKNMWDENPLSIRSLPAIERAAWDASPSSDKSLMEPLFNTYRQQRLGGGEASLGINVALPSSLALYMSRKEK